MFSPLPNKKYEIIYADPPWFLGNGNKTKPNGIGGNKVGRHYQTVPTDELSKIPIRDIAEKDCLLFMWAISPMLGDALKLGVEWGFNYKTVAFVWDKQITNCGNYTLPQIEQVLLFKRGKIPTPRGIRNTRQFYSERKTKHSKKPHEIRKRIEQMFSSQSKIELFARERFEGWDAWGNEV